MMDCKKYSTTPKSGIALITVLGLLSVLLLLAITFAVSMRTSRLAARSYTDVVKSRQLMQVALSQALLDVDTDMAGDSYPAWGALSSSGVTNAPSIITGNATNYIPGDLLAESLAADGAAEWVDIDDPVSGETVGRFAYVAVNCSGLIDVNTADFQDRSFGTNVNEIQVSGLTDLGTFGPGAFLAQRSNTWIRYESLAEIKEAINGEVDSLFSYSRFPVGYLNSSGNIEQPVDLSGSSVGLVSKSAAIVTKMSGISAANPSMFALALLDYLDSDIEPRQTDGFTTEPVPMINEVHITNTLTNVSLIPTAPEYVNQIDIAVELWYPFYRDLGVVPGGYPPPGNWTLTAQVSAVGPLNPSIAVSPPGGSHTIQTSWNSNEIKEYPFRFQSPNTTGTPAIPANLTVDLYLHNGGQDYDRIDTITIPWAGNFVTTLPAIGANTEVVRKEANDPRLNWDWNNLNHWVTVAGGGSLGSVNPSATFAANDGTSFMFVSNIDRLVSVGELGFLLYSENSPWQTIRFLGPDPDQTSKVLDYFTLETNAFSRGKVNFNSQNQEVIESVYQDMQVRRYPLENTLDTPPSVVLNASQINDIAAEFVNNRTYENLSSLTNIPESDVVSALGGGADAALAEGLIRDSVGLLGTRQNMFTILMLVQAVQEVGTDVAVLAEQKALAVIWRDPFADSDGRHATITRFFKWMTD